MGNKWCKEHPEKRAEYRRNSYKRNKKYYQEYQKRQQSERREQFRKRAAEYRKRVKEQAYKILGNVCCKCGFDDARALQVDHVNGGGRKEHKEHPDQFYIYRKIIKDGPDGYQLLCANCNWIKRCENGEINQHTRASKEDILT